MSPGFIESSPWLRRDHAEARSCPVHARRRARPRPASPGAGTDRGEYLRRGSWRRRPPRVAGII